MKYLAIIILIILSSTAHAQNTDWRLLSNGVKIYEKGYIDQPYIVIAKNGTWVCTFTTSPKEEGNAVQYIVSSISSDNGRTWSVPENIEPASGIEASWAIPLVTDYGRIFVFYTYNGDNVRELPNGKKMRADTHGWYCYKYSDDNGKTWSDRHRLDMRVTACDRTNDFSGKVQMFWGIGKPVTKDNNMWFSFTKLGGYFLENSEGWLYHSDNILKEKDILKIHWHLLPSGDNGIRNPQFGSVQEEHNVQPMNMKNGVYCVYRTTLGQLACSYSTDNGSSWSVPELMTYATGLPLRNPRACPRFWKCSNGKYLLWYHNNGNKDFKYRNPAWVSGGIEKVGKILWSQPEILLYSDDISYSTGRLSYPDLVEVNDKYWVSSSQKTAATIHPVPSDFFDNLWNQFEKHNVTRDGLTDVIKDFSPGKKVLKGNLSLNKGGFALDLWIKINKFGNINIIEKNGSASGQFSLNLKQDSTIEFTLTDGNYSSRIISDPGRLSLNTPHHIAIIADDGPGIIYMLIDGSICDGGGQRIFGFEWYDKKMNDLSGNDISLNTFPGQLIKLRFYSKHMLTSQLVGNYHAEKDKYFKTRK